MGNYSKALSKRLRKVTATNDSFWNCSLRFNFEKVRFEERFSREEWCRVQASHGISKRQANVHYDLYCSMEHWMNSEYWVILDKQCQTAIYKTFQGNPLWHLTISRRDEKSFRDWQMLQAIKNDIVGEEFEAIELYPAHSRLMDVGNKYHLWILARKGEDETPPQFPFGCRKFGVASAPGTGTVLVVTERTIKEKLDEIRATLVRHPIEIRIFPDSLRSDV